MDAAPPAFASAILTVDLRSRGFGHDAALTRDSTRPHRRLHAPGRSIVVAESPAAVTAGPSSIQAARPHFEFDLPIALASGAVFLDAVLALNSQAPLLFMAAGLVTGLSAYRWMQVSCLRRASRNLVARGEEVTQAFEEVQEEVDRIKSRGQEHWRHLQDLDEETRALKLEEEQGRSPAEILFEQSRIQAMRDEVSCDLITLGACVQHVDNKADYACSLRTALEGETREFNQMVTSVDHFSLLPTWNFLGLSEDGQQQQGNGGHHPGGGLSAA
eukprot:tig00001636_g9530.t1